MELFDNLMDSLSEQSYGVIDSFLTTEEINDLVINLRKRHAAGSFKEASIGQGSAQHIQVLVRGDQILWLEESSVVEIEQVYFKKINALIQSLNQSCYLGLKDFEFHYALYPIGTFYKRHLDRFKTDSHRKISVICYLNEDWQATDGGELVIYLPNKPPVKISPVGGRLVCFEADVLEHEVLPATHERLSLTGWLKTY
ncbi:2OG-Fe(II) oxygenase [Runella salmonicolor]|uniref:2OG-Fe(II) oxygenase n=1 Tax=Runella salmonicolor TaxID=2950278 RepID=A0ABT1FGN8_9BACT|nr:2OG-Fe(II) oxygenase [Runella salmonicolor]MCP1380918.1 2OG-Fe(II) oxygenase [Runella salmonicolor]